MRLYITYCMHTQITYLHIRILKKKKVKKKEKKSGAWWNSTYTFN